MKKISRPLLLALVLLSSTYCGGGNSSGGRKDGGGLLDGAGSARDSVVVDSPEDSVSLDLGGTDIPSERNTLDFGVADGPGGNTSSDLGDEVPRAQADAIVPRADMGGAGDSVDAQPDGGLVAADAAQVSPDTGRIEPDAPVPAIDGGPVERCPSGFICVDGGILLGDASGSRGIDAPTLSPELDAFANDLANLYCSRSVSCGSTMALAACVAEMKLSFQFSWKSYDAGYANLCLQLVSQMACGLLLNRSLPTECGIAGGQLVRPDGGTPDAPIPLVPLPDSYLTSYVQTYCQRAVACVPGRTMDQCMNSDGMLLANRCLTGRGFDSVAGNSCLSQLPLTSCATLSPSAVPSDCDLACGTTSGPDAGVTADAGPLCPEIPVTCDITGDVPCSCQKICGGRTYTMVCDVKVCVCSGGRSSESVAVGTTAMVCASAAAAKAAFANECGFK